ncbi:Ribosomal RNA small subunit methyltransferase Nep1 [Thermoplasmatales archaeon]|nr:Ribosomal RNA small subunit methyltransferase Nep1 [Thermoplasmatales archaeon]
MLTIIIADAELETIPTEMMDDYSIGKIAKERKKKVANILLDSNYMHSSIDRHFPGESNRRGRPDIIHIFLLMALDSILNRTGGLRVRIHTRNNLVIDISPDTRLPRAYNRFIGLFEKLFQERKIVAEGKTLLSISEASLDTIIGKAEGRVIVMAPGSEVRQIESVIESPLPITVVIGGFSEGDYRSNLDSFEKISIFRDELTIWSVGMEVITQYERVSRNTVD